MAEGPGQLLKHLSNLLYIASPLLGFWGGVGLRTKLEWQDPVSKIFHLKPQSLNWRLSPNIGAFLVG